MRILLTGKRGTLAPLGAWAPPGRLTRPCPTAARLLHRVPASLPATLLRVARATDAPPSDGVVRHDDGSLAMGKHIVRNVDGAPREGDAAVEGHVQKHFDHVLFGESEVQRPTDVAAQGAFPAQRG